jgi:hypothetical protein
MGQDYLPTGELVQLDEVGHYAQEDWAEKVAEVWCCSYAVPPYGCLNIAIDN